MARRIEPKCRLCRREGEKLFLKGMRCFTPKCAIERRNMPPGMHRGGRGKMSNYGLQLREKQKMKKIYGMLEKQFRITFHRALKKKGVTGNLLVETLERRLDNVVYRLLFETSRDAARQLVNHGHVMVNGRKVDVASAIVRVGDVIEVEKNEKLRARINTNVEETTDRQIPEWLALDQKSLTARIVKMPVRSEIALPVHEQSVVELYSK